MSHKVKLPEITLLYRFVTLESYRKRIYIIQYNMLSLFFNSQRSEL